VKQHERSFRLTVTNDLADELDKLSLELCLTRGEVLNKGFALFKRAVLAQREGYSLGLSKDADNLDTELIFL
jgi:hypothetical protein